MKRILIICLLILGLTSTYGFAQMGGGMMGGQGGMKEQKHEMGKGQMMEHKGMMDHGQMMNNMMDMTNQMSGMMGKMSGMMKDMPADKMKNMSGMMRDMCAEMNRMSEMMEKGTATGEEMDRMHERIMQMEKKMPEMTK